MGSEILTNEGILVTIDFLLYKLISGATQT